jgi:hypothetical protein
MSRAFWSGFRKGYTQTSYKMLPIVLALIVGWAFGQYFHPYERCDRAYNLPEDIVECVWLLRSK